MYRLNFIITPRFLIYLSGSRGNQHRFIAESKFVLFLRANEKRDTIVKRKYPFTENQESSIFELLGYLHTNTIKLPFLFFRHVARCFSTWWKFIYWNKFFYRKFARGRLKLFCVEHFSWEDNCELFVSKKIVTECFPINFSWFQEKLLWEKFWKIRSYLCDLFFTGNNWS